MGYDFRPGKWGAEPGRVWEGFLEEETHGTGAVNAGDCRTGIRRGPRGEAQRWRLWTSRPDPEFQSTPLLPSRATLSKLGTLCARTMAYLRAGSLWGFVEPTRLLGGEAGLQVSAGVFIRRAPRGGRNGIHDGGGRAEAWEGDGAGAGVHAAWGALLTSCRECRRDQERLGGLAGPSGRTSPDLGLTCEVGPSVAPASSAHYENQTRMSVKYRRPEHV